MTFDYADASGQGGYLAHVDRSEGRTQCRCGSDRCRGYMPYDETL